MIRPIAISLSPNIEGDDMFRAFKVLASPWQWVRGEAIKKVEKWFERTFHTPFVFSFDSGRSAEYAILRSAGIGVGDEVLIQAFTCVAVPNSILWTGARPIFVDIERETFNIDPVDLRRKITKRSRAIIVQHTFGLASDLTKIQQIAKKHKLLLIEDCAHALGATYKGERMGAIGDAAFFSFGRDKILSSVFGGVAITTSKRLAERLSRFQRDLSFPSHWWILKQLFHPVSFALILPLYHTFNIGKLILFVFQQLSLLSKPVEKKELVGGRPSFYPRKLPNGLAILAITQLKKLEKFNEHRKSIASLYMEKLGDLPLIPPKTKNGDIFLRFPVFLANGVRRDTLFTELKKRGVLLGKWYSHVIDPVEVDLAKVYYTKGNCPMAEQAARRVLNLPTYPTFTLGEAKKLVLLLKRLTKK